MDDLTLAARLVDESPDALLALAPNGRVLSWNRGAEAIFGYSAAEAVGHMLEELVVPEQQLEEARRQLATTLSAGW